MTQFRHGVATATGNVRRLNEDSYLAESPLYAVADGMGGHGSGEVASALAVGMLTACSERANSNRVQLSVEAVLETVHEANEAIMAAEGAPHMGTTLTGLASIQTSGGSHLMVFNVGDSRVYRLAEGRLDQVTVDHSEVTELVLAGALTRDEARHDPRRNIITRALGTDPAPVTDHWLLPARVGERYLLCSDGLSGELTDERILELLADDDPQGAANALVAAAEEAGGHDNITAVVVDIVDVGDDEVAWATTTPRDHLPDRP
jgi:PPM family protein phosphatase